MCNFLVLSSCLWLLGCPSGLEDDSVRDSGGASLDSGSPLLDAGSSRSDTGDPVTTYIVTVEAGLGGSIEPNGAIPVEAGDRLSLAISPEEMMVIAEVDSRCGGELDGMNYVTAPVVADCNVSVTFQNAPSPEPAVYCSGIPAAQADLIVCDPEQSLDDWSQGRVYPTNSLRIPRGKVVALPFTSNARGLHGTIEITNNMPGLHASGFHWHAWFSAVPGGAPLEDRPGCHLYSPNPNPMSMRWNQTESGARGCHLGRLERTLYVNMEVACFEAFSDRCTPGDRYADDYYHYKKDNPFAPVNLVEQIVLLLLLVVVCNSI